MGDVEDLYRKITGLPRVIGFIVITLDGIAIKSTLDPSTTLKYAGQIAPLVDKARKMIRELVVDEEENTTDDVTFIRLRTKTHELLIAPDNDYAMVVLQLPHPILTETEEGEEGEPGEPKKEKVEKEEAE